jgi:Arc/MetJ-type ribon-helix-helix transcriptional regulator
MMIHLSEQRKQLILSLVQAGKFASSDDVVDEGLRLVEERYRQPEETSASPVISETNQSSDRTAEQLENLKRLSEKLDNMPTAAVALGLSNRDHDRMLYGR